MVDADPVPLFDLPLSPIKTPAAPPQPCPSVSDEHGPCVLADVAEEHARGHETEPADGGARRAWSPTAADHARWEGRVEPSIADRFAAFHEANPHVYAALRRLALDLVTCGQTRFGVGMLFEVLRWHYALTATDPTGTFVLNNNYRPYFARMLAEREPALRDVFEFRALHDTENED